MNHPEDQLAPYVDGALPPEERVAVETHLARCDVCREEVALASQARTALAGLRGPVTVPGSVGDRAITEATAGIGSAGAPSAAGSRTSAPAAPGAPRWQRWIGAAAAAAAVALAVVVVAPALTGRDAEPADMTAAAPDALGEAGSAREATAIERIPGNLTAEQLPQLADGALLAPPTDAQSDQAHEATAAPGTEGAFQAAGVPAVTRCLQTALPSIASEPLRLVSIRFEDTPAYGGVFSMPATDEVPFDSFQVVVASREDCSLLSVAAAPA